MSLSSKNLRIINKLIPVAQESDINTKLSAALINGSKIIGRPMCNTNRTYCRGKICPSMHAEAATIMQFYGKSLVWSDRYGWRVLREKGLSTKVT
jgi:hypothetical protein